MTFKKGKLKKNERWSTYDEIIEIVSGINCLGVNIETTGGLTKHKTKWKESSDNKNRFIIIIFIICDLCLKINELYN
jgi:hypothetical protein